MLRVSAVVPVAGTCDAPSRCLAQPCCDVTAAAAAPPETVATHYLDAGSCAPAAVTNVAARQNVGTLVAKLLVGYK